MKKIECFIRETDMESLVAALAKANVGGVTVFPVQGFGRQKGKGGGGRLLPKVKLELFVLDIEVDRILATIMKMTRKGQFGDGKLAVLPVDDVVRIRTGEKGAKALY